MKYSKYDLFEGAVLTNINGGLNRNDYIIKNIDISNDICELHFTDAHSSPHMQYPLQGVINILGMGYIIKNNENYDIF